MLPPVPASFIRDAVLLGRDVARDRVSDDDLLYLKGTMRQSWPAQWEELAESGAPTASRQNFCELLMPVMTADGTAVAGTTEGVLFPAAYTALPPNFFDSPGKTVRFRAFGLMTTGATPGTLTLTPRYGTTTGGTSLGAGTVSGTLVASKTNVPWFIDATIICRAIGGSGSIAFFGIWECPQGYTTAPGIVEAGQGAVTTVDTTASTGGLTIGSTASNAGTSLTARKLAIESLN